MNIDLSYIVNKFLLNDNVSVICNFDVAEELCECLEDADLYISEEEYSVLSNPNITSFIVSRVDGDIYIEDLYNADGSICEIHSEYVYLQYGLLSDRERNFIHSYKEQKILVVYNI